MDHGECLKGTHPEFLPSRLIDIGLDGTVTPRLIDTSVLRAPQRYISLSHCWGGKITLTLREDSLAAMRLGINYKDLPKTFQHALIVTRELGCRYIWVDSLCIIQDSHVDWVKESSQMDKVYSNSFCNIAASAAENSTRGLFFYRNPDSIIPLRMVINGIGYFLDPPHVSMYKMVEEAPLNFRGWVYQERFLSPRILHFTASQLFWECRTHSACETYPITYPTGDIFLSPIKRFNPGVDGIRIRQRDGGHIFNISQDEFLDAFAVWNEIVTNYSQCCLTQETDRLVAISGVAAKVNETMDDEYLAGMWREHLPYNLTWQASGENKRPATYTAPSWSWASITGKVQKNPLKNLLYEQSVEIVEASVELAGPSRFGQVTNGFIKLKGSLMAMPLSICCSGQMQPCAGCIEDSRTLSLGFALDVSRPGVGRNEEASQCLHFPISWAKSIAGGYSKKSYEYLLVYGMPILAYWSGDRREVEGLLLEATSNNISEFRRIGRFSYGWWRDAQGDASSQYLEAFQAFDSQAASLGFKPILTSHLNHDVHYTITII